MCGKFRARHRLDRSSRRHNRSSSGEIRRPRAPSQRVLKARAPCRKSQPGQKAGRSLLLSRVSVPRHLPTTGAK
jgi:hypothetical protein